MGLPEFGADSTFEHLNYYLVNRSLRATIRPPYGQTREWVAVFVPAHARHDSSIGYVGRGHSMWDALNLAAQDYESRKENR